MRTSASLDSARIDYLNRGTAYRSLPLAVGTRYTGPTASGKRTSMDLFNSSMLSLSFSTVPSIREMTTVSAQSESASAVNAFDPRRGRPSRPDVRRRSTALRNGSYLVVPPHTGCSWLLTKLKMIARPAEGVLAV